MFNFDNLVVVGRVSMNKKKAKRNLQRIANGDQSQSALRDPIETVSSGCSTPTFPPAFETPKVQPVKAVVQPPKEVVQVKVMPPQEPAAPVAPFEWADESNDEAETPVARKCWADMVSDSEDDEPIRVVVPKVSRPKMETAAPVSVAPVAVVADEVAADEAPASKKRTHRGGRSAAKRLEQDLRKAPALAETTALACLPDAILARIFEGLELSAVGAAASTCRGLRTNVWSSAGFWAALAGSSNTASADSFRAWLFGIQGDWATAFSTYCGEADPVAALGEAAYLAGGLMKSEARDAPTFVDAVVTAAGRVDQDWLTAERSLSVIQAKAADRTKVFSSKSVAQIKEASDLLRERALLAKLNQDDGWTGFDPFAAAPEEEFNADEIDVFAEPKDEEAPLDINFANTFLDMLRA